MFNPFHWSSLPFGLLFSAHSEMTNEQQAFLLGMERTSKKNKELESLGDIR